MRINSDSDNYVEQWAGHWENTAVVSGIHLFPQNGQFLSGSYFQAVGIKSQWVVTEGTFGDMTIIDGMIVP
jgi:hypothetical protein